MCLADRFRAFFTQANGGRTPYPWQVALVEAIAAAGSWPAAISAPTGSGKSAVVDIHVFLVAERARQVAAGETPTVLRPPRRLVLVAPRRVLVDDQHERALALQAAIAHASSGSALGDARSALEGLRTARDGEALAVGVARLRGGVLIDRSWRLDPGICQVICATPQMWGSRLLLRGFRGSRRSRNLESGLLTQDVAVVVDEAHLHERLVDTATRVAAMGTRSGALQLVAMSATRPVAGAYGLTSADFEDPSLARRVAANKAVKLTLVEDVARDAITASLVATALAARAQSPDAGTLGIFVNTVDRALEVTARLRAQTTDEVRIVCGRMRPADLVRLRHTRPGLLDARGNADVAYLVSTQSLEVGVDLDLGAMVSEAAPASALAQRAGRLNRSGSRESATLDVVSPATFPDDEDARLGPYRARHVKDGISWLRMLAGDSSPARVAAVPLPEERRLPLPAISGAEIETAAMTSPALAADLDVDFYVDEPTDRNPRRISVGARRYLDLGDEVVEEALLAAPPRAHELAQLTLPPSGPGTVLAGILAASADAWLLRTVDGVPTAKRLRTDDDGVSTDDLRADDVVVIAAGSRVAFDGVVGAPRGKAEPIDDVMGQGPDGAQDWIFPLADAAAEDVDGLSAQDRVLGTRDSRRKLAQICADQRNAELAAVLRRHRYLADLSVTWARRIDTHGAGLLVVVRTRRGSSTAPRVVPLLDVTVDDHGPAVRSRMSDIVDSLDGLVAREARSLLDAAAMHDEGKRHPRFQRRMGASPDGPALAKPTPRHVPDRGDGWRHEQYSAAISWASGDGALSMVLVAAHHGAGRPLFDRDADGVLDGWAGRPEAERRALEELYGAAGRYELERTMVERTQGVHRLAFLEALLRCADMQVSREVDDDADR